MLNKNEIIKELANEEFLIRNAVYEYVCKLHLYDDEKINKALIEFIENNYQSINFVGLIYSKLNKEIIECLIKILLKEKDKYYKEKISTVLVEHYNLIKDMNYYFSNICNDEIVNSYIDFLKGFRKKYLEDYFYDIAEYLNSNVIDEFLFEELERIKDIKIRENIIRILANRFNKDVIPYALDFIKRGEFDDEEGLKEAIAPLLILENCNDGLSKNIIEEVKNFDMFDLLRIDDEKRIEIMSNVLNKIQNLLLKDKPHIKKYKKIRKLHNEIMENMMKYVYEGKFEFKVDSSRNKINIKNIKYLDTEFDTSTELGIQAMSNVLVYKNSCNTNCVTEEYIEKKKFRTEEKNELLESMLNSVAGLFEITETDREKGQVHLKDVLTNKEYCITDIGFSSNLHNDKIYLYTRIITYQDISFGTGFNLVFDKNDEFICKWIKENLNKPEKQEIERFIELYNEYKKDSKGIKLVTKNI